MVAVGMGLVWLGYAAGLWGFSLVQGYNLSLGQLVSPTSYYKGKWPPQKAGNTVILPTGTKASLTSVALSGGTPGTSSSTPGSAASVQNSGVIQRVAALFGWGGGAQYNSLTHLIAQESGGNPQAKNKTSGALGIAQALGKGNANTAGSLGNEYGGYGLTDAQARKANSGDAYYQLVWMMHYIQARYGSPDAAWAHEQSYGWY